MGNTVNVKFKKLHPQAKIPTYGSADAAGCDLYAAFDGDPIAVAGGSTVTIDCGFAMELPAGYEAQVRPRSGLAAKHQLTVLNTPGTIDADYRGEVKVILHNAGERTYYVNPGDRIAQMVIQPVWRAEFEEVEELSSSERGTGGFGSTGTN